MLASKFGHLEHWFARFLGGYLLIMTILLWSVKWWIALMLWLVYFVSHTLEKFFYKITNTSFR